MSRTKSGEKAYMRLYIGLREAIVQGNYPLGSRLPSKRTLADEAGVSLVTVEHAYALLVDEGYATARERSGYFVSYAPDALLAALPGSEEGALPIRRNGDAADKPNDATPFPFSVYARTMRRVLGTRGEAILGTSEAAGSPVLRAALADYLARSRGIHVSPEQIIIGAGAEYLYSLVVQMLGRDCLYALEDPSYKKIRQVYEANGAACEGLALGAHGIRGDALASCGADVLHVTPFNSYPSGVTATASKRHAYIRWAKERGATIVEDDYDSEFSALTKAEDTLFSLEPKNTVIYLNTFSRTIASSMRMGYMVLPAERTEELASKISFYACTVPLFEQYVLAEFLDNGDFERHINRVRRQRREEQDAAGNARHSGR